MTYFPLLLIILCISSITSYAFGTTNFKRTFGTHQQQQQHTTFGSLLSSQRDYLTRTNNIKFMIRGGSIGSSCNTNNNDKKRTVTELMDAITSTETISSADFISIENLSILSERGRVAIENLIHHDNNNDSKNHRGVQKHVYTNWPPQGIDDDGKRKLCEQIADLDASYPGGLSNYLLKARQLLQESADGTNPFDDYTATVPMGESLSFNDESGSCCTMPFATAEEIGVQACAGLVVVLVAGGLGERLGYSGIKISLETELCTNTIYVEHYINYIQALTTLARKTQSNNDITIPLVIMTSGDTDSLTRKLLIDNNYFGMDANLIKIVTQDKVAALKDGFAGLALDDDDRWTIQTKPHGHGDVHHLLYREGLVDQWEKDGKTHVVFIQDTNALVVNGIIPSLGVSVSKGFHMNSLCIPRLAGEAAGAIARLNHKTDPNKSLVINVEYNQLDPLLRTQGDCTGDVADPETGYSPFPGNANNLVIELSSYAQTLRGVDQGVVLEFVNPKYKDSTRTNFKKPTRLECMMQDIPKLFQKELGADANIGFTNFDRWFSFSPAKNSLESGQEAVAAGNTAPGTMSSAESDLYVQNQKKLMHVGVTVPVSDYDDYVALAGIPVTAGPRIVLEPSFGITRKEYIEKIIGPVTITERSSFVLAGQHVTIKKLNIDGALVIRASPNSYVTVDGLHVTNAGWTFQELQDNVVYPEEVRIRGYTINKVETAQYIIDEPGHFVIDESGEVKKIG